MVREYELEQLAHSDYWNSRYKAENQKSSEPVETASTDDYEWFGNYKKLHAYFSRHLPAPSSNPHVLHLGCGNSTLTADLYGIGYTNQTSVDFSDVVIESMQSKYASLNTEWKVMDVRDLQIPDGSIDVAVDKGTLDAMIHGSMWDPPPDVRENVEKYAAEVARVLRLGGQWLYITYRQPHFIRLLLTREKDWSLEVEVLEHTENAGVFEYYGYTMRKHKGK